MAGAAEPRAGAPAGAAGAESQLEFAHELTTFQASWRRVPADCEHFATTVLFENEAEQHGAWNPESDSTRDIYWHH